MKPIFALRAETIGWPLLRKRPAPLVETDPQSGRAYLKIPVPDPATVQRLADALRDLLVARP